MLGVHTEHDRFLHAVAAGLEVVADPFRHPQGASIDHQVAIEILLVVEAILNLHAAIIHVTRLRAIAFHVHIEMHTDHFVGRQEAIADALLERIGVEGLTEVLDVRHIFGFLRCGGEADLGGIAEIGEDLAPGRILRRAAAMAFIHHDQIEEAR